MKESGVLEQNLNRLPILHHNELILGQSSAINQYLAQLFGLMGTSIAEAAQIQAMVAHADDIKAAYRKLGRYRAPANRFRDTLVLTIAVRQENQPALTYTPLLIIYATINYI